MNNPYNDNSFLENSFIDLNNNNLLLDPKIDIVFKRIFGEPENKDILINFFK